MTQVIPGYIGSTNNPTSNLGETATAGWTCPSPTALQGRWKLSNTLNYTHFRNLVIDVAGETGFLNGWGWPVRNTAITRMTEGYAVGHFVGYEADGIFQNEADIFFTSTPQAICFSPMRRLGHSVLDSNGDGVINSDDITDIGNPWPKHILGLSSNFTYKFYVNTIFSTQLGHDIYRTYERTDVPYSNYQSFWMDRWTPDNPSSELLA